ncbi:RluA family pseudouridine synthase [bacterium]|nr:RluA family pseudouridine synthase [bacterium]
MSDRKKSKKAAARPGAAGGSNAAATGLERSWEGTVVPGGGGRADKYLADTAGILSRSQLKARGALLRVNGRQEKLSRTLAPGDRLELRWTDEPSHRLEPERLEVDIVYEDERVFVFDKAQGMVTHPAAGNWRGTLANAALWLDADRKGKGAAAGGAAPFGCAPRGGIVHRLDKDTSGIIVVARDAEAHEFLAAQFKNRSARKEYWAIVHPAPPDDAGHIENFLARDKNNRKKFAGGAAAGKRAATDYRVLLRWSIAGRCDYALIALFPKTGRTHQLRVHMSGIGCPIVGDPLYGRKDQLFPEATLMLHARRLRITLPGRDAPSLFKAPPPERFRAMAAALDRLGRRTRGVGA